MKSAKQACNRDRSPSRWKLSPLKHVFSNKAYFYFEFERCLFPVCITFPIRSFTPAQRVVGDCLDNTQRFFAPTTDGRNFSPKQLQRGYWCSTIYRFAISFTLQLLGTTLQAVWKYSPLPQWWEVAWGFQVCVRSLRWPWWHHYDSIRVIFF